MNMVGGRRKRQIDNQLGEFWCNLSKSSPPTVENVIFGRFLLFSMAELMNWSGVEAIRVLKSCNNTT